MVRQLCKQWLISRISAPQREEANVLRIELDLASGEPVRPVRRQSEAISQQAHSSGLVASSQEDHGAFRLRPQIQFESGGEGAAKRCEVSAAHTAGAMRSHVSRRQLLKMHHVLDAIALPHFALPQRVEAFDGILEAMLSRRGKHRRDTQGEAQTRSEERRVGKECRL